MKIIEKAVDTLIPYENNPRRNDEAVKYVANSIKEFGFKVPIVIDKDNVIIAGHTRLKAAQELGIEKVPCIVADDLTEEQIKAFRLADNKTGEQAAWDYAKLGEELEDIVLDMLDFGFLDYEIEDAKNPFNKQALDDLFEETEAKPKEPKKIQCPHCGEYFEI